jgi:acyl-CoA thioesterase II
MLPELPKVSSPPPRELKDILDLEQLDSNLFRSRANQANHNNALFGGQILGQGLKAAALTVDDRDAHSLHGYFLLPGASDIPVIYDVELTRDGGSFSTRRVVARQRLRVIFHMEVSFHRKEEGYEHELALDIGVPEPESLLNLSDLATKYFGQKPGGMQPSGGQQIVELRPVSPEDFLTRKAATARGLYWMKSTTPLPDDALTQLAGLAYLSDYFLTPTAVIQHVTSIMSGKIMAASLDHAMWFHRPCRADEWLLVNAMSPFAGGARGLTRAEIYDRSRRLIASVAQEGLVRPIDPNWKTVE